MKRQLEIHIDGACIGNPGQAAIGVIIQENGKKVKEVSKTIGQGTNNIAEYSALITALKEAVLLRADKVRIYTDSELLFKQVTNQYKIKNENLKLLFEEAAGLAEKFTTVEIKQIPREQNSAADGLASKALKKRQAKMVASVFTPIYDTGEESPSSRG